jgi:polygalacturonase
MAAGAVAVAASIWLVGATAQRPARADTAGPGAASAVSEHFNDNAVGVPPAGWGVDASGGTVAVRPVPDQVDRSLQLTKSGTAGAAFAERRVATALTGTVHAEARVRVSQAAGWFNVLYVAGSTGTPAASIAIRDGRFHNAGGGEYVGSAAPLHWYVVRVVLDTGRQRFDLFVDGQRLLADVPFRQGVTDIGRITVGIGAGHAGTLHVDNITMRRVPDPSVRYHAFDLYDDVPVGALPTGYGRTAGAGAIGVAALPSAEDRSLRLSKSTAAGEAGVARTFDAQTGTVTVLANVRTDETAGVKAALYAQSADGRTAASIQFSNGHLQVATGATPHTLRSGVRSGEWYTVRLVLDVAAKRFTVYVDGKRYPAIGTAVAPTRWEFRDPSAGNIARLWFAVGAGQTGTLSVDKVMVYHNPVAEPAGTVVDVRGHGARGDGTGNDGPAIQSAIDAVPPGGTVYLAGGVFRSGTIRLKSNMTLYVAPDAMLLGTTDETAYPQLRGGSDNPPFVGGNVQRALVFAHRADNVVIEGGGVINGNGRNPAWTGSPPASGWPVGMFLARGRHVTIRNIHVKDTATWNVVPTEITGLTVADVDIDNDIVGTRDGIDVVDSDDVLIERVSVVSDDDSISFKSHPTSTAQVQPDSPSHGVDGAVVRLSTVAASTRANGVKFGTASHGAFRDVVVEDMLVKNITIGALVITAVDGAIVHNITFRRITVDRTKRAIFVLIGRRIWVDGTGLPHPALAPKWISGLRFEDITATAIAHGQPPNHLGNAIAMSGTAEPTSTAKLYDILVSNSRFTLAAGGTATPAEPAEYDGRYPEAWHWTTLRAYGAFLRHVNGIALRGVSYSVPDSHGRPATDFRNVVDAR